MERTVEVNIVHAELAQGLIELLLDVLRRVIVVPELGSDEEVLPLADLWNDPLQRGTDFVLVLVDQSAIDVPVTLANGNLDLVGKQNKHAVSENTRPAVRTAFSTSPAFESHVPKPIWGSFWPVESVRMGTDIVATEMGASVGAEKAGNRRSSGEDEISRARAGAPVL